MKQPLDYVILGLGVSRLLLTEDQQYELLDKLSVKRVVVEYPAPKNFREKLAKWIRGY